MKSFKIKRILNVIKKKNRKKLVQSGRRIVMFRWSGRPLFSQEQTWTFTVKLICEGTRQDPRPQQCPKVRQFEFFFSIILLDFLCFFDFFFFVCKDTFWGLQSLSFTLSHEKSLNMYTRLPVLEHYIAPFWTLYYHHLLQLLSIFVLTSSF